MRPPPPLSDFPRFPIVGGIALLAIAATLAWWREVDVSMLMDDPHIALGEVWRLATSTLLHANVLHLAFNVYWLWVFGTVVEEAFGHVRTLGILLLFAVGSSGAEYALYAGGVGLSGVGYGLFGMLWALSRHHPRFADAVDQNTVLLFAVWFVLCIAMTWTGAMAVANVAHGAGAVLGALLGWAIGGPRRWRAVAGVGTALAFAAAAVGATVARPWVNRDEHRGQREATLAYTLLVAEQPAKAERLLRQATAMRPADPGAWFNLGVALSRLDRPAEAEAAFARARALDPAAGR